MKIADRDTSPAFPTSTYFLRIPKNIRSFDVSSGGFSTVAWALFTLESEEDEGAVEAGEASTEPDDAEAISIRMRLEGTSYAVA